MIHRKQNFSTIFIHVNEYMRLARAGFNEHVMNAERWGSSQIVKSLKPIYNFSEFERSRRFGIPSYSLKGQISKFRHLTRTLKMKSRRSEIRFKFVPSFHDEKTESENFEFGVFES